METAILSKAVVRFPVHAGCVGKLPAGCIILTDPKPVHVGGGEMALEVEVGFPPGVEPLVEVYEAPNLPPPVVITLAP